MSDNCKPSGEDDAVIGIGFVTSGPNKSRCAVFPMSLKEARAALGEKFLVRSRKGGSSMFMVTPLDRMGKGNVPTTPPAEPTSALSAAQRQDDDDLRWRKVWGQVASMDAQYFPKAPSLNPSYPTVPSDKQMEREANERTKRYVKVRTEQILAEARKKQQREEERKSRDSYAAASIDRILSTESIHHASLIEKSVNPRVAKAKRQFEAGDLAGVAESYKELADTYSALATYARALSRLRPK